MDKPNLIPHLFRTEFRKIVSVLSKRFGLENIEIAEDITSETFLLAAETWGKKGIPDNPSAWLYVVAKNKTKDFIKRKKLFNDKIKHDVKREIQGLDDMNNDIANDEVKDSELKMIFAICHPSIPLESQIGLALRILFGFGIDEIAAAFLSNKETINKRLHRSKEKLREKNVKLELPSDQEIPERLEAVCRTIYLLFNQGYYSLSNNPELSKDLCHQALQLAYTLTEGKSTNTAEINALISLMCFHTSRFDARYNENGFYLLAKQDKTYWDLNLIRKGEEFLNKSAVGVKVSKYHLEAAIAFWHTQDEHQNKWPSILKYYNLLLQVEYSPIAALNRTYALFMNYGAEMAIIEALKLQLDDNKYYHALLGHLYQEVNKKLSRAHYERAVDLANSDLERNLLLEKMKEHFS